MLTRTQLKPRGSKSAKRRRVTHARCFGAPRPDGDTRDAAIRRMPCLGLRRPEHRCRGAVQAAHVEPRRMGGRGGDRFRQAPLCSLAHREAGELPSLWYRSTPELYATTTRGQWEAAHAFEPEGLLTEADRIAERLTEEGYP